MEGTLALFIPIIGILAGIIIATTAIVSEYRDKISKRQTAIEIAKHLEDPEQVERLITLFDERKKEPLDYRRGGVITIFVGIGLFFLGVFALGGLLKGVGALVGLIGVGTLVAGYLYPNTSGEINRAVEDFEKQ